MEELVRVEIKLGLGKLMKFCMYGLGALAIGAAVGWQAAFAQQPSATSETYGSWIFRCSIPAKAEKAGATQENGEQKPENELQKACETIQVLRDSNGNVIAQIAFGKDATEPKKLVGVFQVPQGTLLSEPVKFGVEKGTDPLIAPYFTCLQSVCLARVDTNIAELQKLDGKTNGALEFADRSGRKINVLLSLNGFAAAISRLTREK